MNEMDKWEDIKDDFPYIDILELEHPSSKNHPRQPMESRAGQFSPYAALTGYGEAVKETERYTWEETYLDEDRKARLNEVMLYLQNSSKKEFIRILLHIIFSFYFKITLWMSTYWTYFRSFFSYNYMSTVSTNPNSISIFTKY